MKIRWRKRDLRRISRGLRFRLTAGYAILFTIILILVATGFRQFLQLKLDEQVTEDLNDTWAAVKGGYLRINLYHEEGKYFADWYYDENDPDERTIVGDIKQIFVVTDRDGNVLLDYTTHEPQIST